MDLPELSQLLNLERGVRRGSLFRLSMTSRELVPSDVRLLRQAHTSGDELHARSTDGSALGVRVLEHFEVNAKPSLGTIHSFTLEVCADEHVPGVPDCEL